MPSEHSFDIVSKVDLQEVRNAVTMAQKEISQRFDFRGSGAKLDLDDKAWECKLEADNDYQLKSLTDVLLLKLTKRGISPRALRHGTVETTPGGTLKQVLTLQQGIPQEKAKEIVRLIKETKLKVQAQIQGDEVRVTAKQIDDLQAVIALVTAKDFGIDMQFINYR